MEKIAAAMQFLLWEYLSNPWWIFCSHPARKCCPGSSSRFVQRCSPEMCDGRWQVADFSACFPMVSLQLPKLQTICSYCGKDNCCCFLTEIFNNWNGWFHPTADSFGLAGISGMQMLPLAQQYDYMSLFGLEEGTKQNNKKGTFWFVLNKHLSPQTGQKEINCFILLMY